MRYAAAALVLVTIATILLATQDARRTEEGRSSATEGDPARADSADLNGAGVIPSGVPRPMASAEQTASVSLPTAKSTQSSLPPRFRQNPELRGQIIAFLSESGLSEVDGERIADEVLDGLKACVEDAFGNDDEAIRDNILQTCMLNVLADHGLPVGNAAVTQR